jgi:hypothetical protein
MYINLLNHVIQKTGNAVVLMHQYHIMSTTNKIQWLTLQKQNSKNVE